MVFGAILKKVLTTPFTGGIAARTAMGAGIGAIAGGVRGDVTGQRRFDEVLKHAALGAIGGAALHGAARFGPRIAKATWKPALSASWGATKGTLKGTAAAGKFTWKHPYLAAGGVAAAGAVGGGLYMAGRGGATPGSSPTMTGTALNVNYNQQAIALSEMGGGISPMGFMGTAPQFEQYREQQMYRDRLRNSTIGLVGGLHRGRH